MGHAEHFLQRLDRVSDRQVELALTLYRDHQLVRSVLDGAQLPDGVERVALSLDHDLEGPFVVLTRDGRFVTCLAVGMRVSGLPIITRTRLDVLSAREQRVRDELARIRQVTEGGSDGQVKRALRALLRNGARLCREDAELISIASPLLGQPLLRLGNELRSDVHRYSPLVAALRFDRLSHEQHELTQALEQAIWACSHLDTIFAAQLASSVLSFDEAQYRATVAAAVLNFDWCVSAQGLRSLWAASRSGKDGLHYLRHTVSTRAHLTTGLFSELALGAFAHASSKLRAEAIKAMTKPSSPLLGPFPADESPRAAVARTIMLGFEQDPASFDALLLVLGRGVVARACPEFDAPDIDLVQAVPDAVAYAALTNQARSWQADDGQDIFTQLALMLPWLARASLADLYLPRAWLDKLVKPTGLDHFERWFRLAPCVALPEKLRRRTVTAPPKVGRNEACGCGSGRKRKHCCGRVGSVV